MNSVSIVGRMVRDPETRESQAGDVICKFCVAVDKRTKDGENTADFLDCVAFGKTGEFVAKWFPKGKRVGVEGAIHTRTWTDDQGKNHKVTEITARQISFVDSKAPWAWPAASAAPAANNGPQTAALFEVMDDDLPF